MASLAAENDQWLFISDFIFARVSDNGSFRNGALGFDFHAEAGDRSGPRRLQASRSEFRT